MMETKEDEVIMLQIQDTLVSLDLAERFFLLRPFEMHG